MERRQQMVWAAAIVACLLALTSAAQEGGFRRYWRLRRDVLSLEARNTKLKAENDRLRREVDALREDPASIERSVREDLGYVRPGEIVFYLEGR